MKLSTRIADRIDAFLHSFCTRRCNDLQCHISQGWHTAHLTAIGRWRHVWRFR